jgi:hypothetical protein
MKMGWGVFFGCWAGAAAIALMLGRDTSWDLRNYHYYNAYALLEGRWAVDLAPARAHTFLHPGLDLPFYLLTQGPLNAWPRLISVLQASYAALLAFVTLSVASLVCHGLAWRVTAASGLVACFGLTGAATLPQIGATYNDIQIGCLVVGALLALLLAPAAEEAAQPGQADRLRLLAGAITGAAVALKLTAAIFPPGLALAAAIAARGGAGPRVRAVSLLTIGGILGFTVVYGPWGWFLWKWFGNPFGPLFNDTFGSPLFPLDAQRDLRFLPSGLTEALAYPLLWAHRTQGLVLEPPLADPRFAIALAALALVVAIGAWRWLHRSRYANAVRTTDTLYDPAHRVAARAEQAVLAFVLVSYAGWLGLFSILRYAVPIEVLLGIPLWAAARQFLTAMPEQGGASPVQPRRAGATLCVATALGISALVTEYPAHPREPFAWDQEPQGLAAVAVGHIALPAGSLVAMIGPAVSFVAPFLDGPGVRFVGGPNFEWAGAATDPASYAAQVLRAVQSHPGPTFAVLEFADSYDWEAARALGISFDPASCQRVPNNLTTAVQLCSLAMSRSRSM